MASGEEAIELLNYRGRLREPSMVSREDEMELLSIRDESRESGEANTHGNQAGSSTDEITFNYIKGVRLYLITIAYVSPE